MAKQVSTRRQFLAFIGRVGGFVTAGLAGLRLMFRPSSDAQTAKEWFASAGAVFHDQVWQLNPNICDGCKDLNRDPNGLSRCATACVLPRSAVRAVNHFHECGYCLICPGYHDVSSPQDENGVPTGRVCPYDAITRTRVGTHDPNDPNNDRFEYTIDEDKCTGCGKCVIGCKPNLGNGSLRLEVRYDLCKNCNQCAIARVCPAKAAPSGPDCQGAFARVPINALPLKYEGSHSA